MAQSATLEELLAVQSQVQAVLDQARKAVVVLESGDGTASGVIVSPQGLVLSAAHVTNTPGRKFNVRLQSGASVEGESLGLDTATDAAMLQLPAPAKAWPYATINREMRGLKLGDWCFALGNPGGWDAARGSVLRVGKLVKISPNMLQSDCVLMGGDSGGALFNLAGEVIGINSQIWRGLDQNLHVSMAPFLRSWDLMKKGEVIREWRQGSGAWIGLSTQESHDGLLVQAVAPDSPAMKAGLKDGDTIFSLNNQKLAAPAEFSELINARAAGEIVTLKIRSASLKVERMVEVKLGKRPQE
ncbi:MAG TPA: S1C family serine protease [Verrucomicrobiaceae bacterium]